jgi:hypothetical protein
VINCAIYGFSELCFRKFAIKRDSAFNPGAIRLRPRLSLGKVSCWKPTRIAYLRKRIALVLLSFAYNTAHDMLFLPTEHE